MSSQLGTEHLGITFMQIVSTCHMSENCSIALPINASQHISHKQINSISIIKSSRLRSLESTPEDTLGFINGKVLQGRPLHTSRLDFVAAKEYDAGVLISQNILTLALKSIYTCGPINSKYRR